MIGMLRGRIAYRAEDHVMLDVGGVGYIVYCSERTLAGLPGAGEVAELFTELIVREDLLQLVGFTTLVEKEWHRLLLSVQGIGAKGALAILGALGADGVSRALALGDAGAIRTAPGVGPKIAQRVVNELKDKAPAVMALGAGAAVGGGATDPIEGSPAPAPRAAAPPAVADGAATAEALSALANLGYAPGEAAAAVAEVAGETEGTADLIRAALRRLAPKG